MKYLLFLTAVLIGCQPALADYNNSPVYPETKCTSGLLTLYVNDVAQTPQYNQSYTAEVAAIAASQKNPAAKVQVITPPVDCKTTWKVNPTYSFSSAASSNSSVSSSRSSAASSTPSNASWTIRADFESGAVNSVAIGTDRFSGTTKAVISDELPAPSGTRIAKLPITGGTGGFGEWGGIFDFPTPLKSGDEVRISLKIYWPTGFFYNANPWLKFLRVKTPSGYNDIYIPNSGSAQPFQFIYEGENVWSRFGTSADAIKFDVWERYEYQVTFDDVSVDNGGMARVRFLKDGKLLADLTQRKTLSNDSQTATAFYLFTYWNGLNSPTQFLYVDDVTITAKIN